MSKNMQNLLLVLAALILAAGALARLFMGEPPQRQTLPPGGAPAGQSAPPGQGPGAGGSQEPAPPPPPQ